ncbi:myelin and lymphocyte protein isoform X1 [Pipra filicauda]|uniref:Myelin and lymphocyte protein n=1 Tax=Pipra filicauda TaxID=649802 RepID=A0A7R5KKJ3_9PASS|nr:myelin and lymphocyte protein isoform X1 [Pipra filicauda]
MCSASARGMHGTLCSGSVTLSHAHPISHFHLQIFGGLVWILVASSKVPIPMLQGWVMFVSVFCFIMSTTLMCLYFCGAHGGSSSWVALDAICQGTASLFYLSAAVLEAYATYVAANLLRAEIYRENIAAVVFAFVATLVYVIHKVCSLLRWKSS